MPALTEAQRRQVEENLGLVGKVLGDCVHSLDSAGIYTYDDLFQIGSIGLCKAVQTDRPGRGQFSTYAYALIRNEIYSQLEYATRRGREQATDPVELVTKSSEPAVEEAAICGDLMELLDKVERDATGVTAKGLQAIRLLAQGYKNREIGEMFGTTANNVTAWVARARARIKECIWSSAVPLV